MSAKQDMPGWKEIPKGGLILEAGNAFQYRTGDWRSRRPIWKEDRCRQCLLCWIFCPDGAVKVEEGRVVGFDYDHCKGCGICATECPPAASAIEMVPESEFAK